MIYEKILADLNVKIFADGADLDRIKALIDLEFIEGFTTNPTLMRKAGITDYVGFAKNALDIVGEKPISFEVFSDDIDEIRRQAVEISSWGSNVYVKVPICDSKGRSNLPTIGELSRDGVKVNATALMTTRQVEGCLDVLSTETESYISIFAGRVADTGVNPKEIIQHAVSAVAGRNRCEIIWASPREVLNVFEASHLGCDIITVTDDIISRFKKVGFDLDQFSLETVKMFQEDAEKSGFTI